jgi:F420-non-reducing hydrogenase iron-sulfur subunit
VISAPIIRVLACRTARASMTGADDKPMLSPGVDILELPCGGRADEVTILRCLRQGAWGVLVMCCLDGNCRNATGTYEARRRVDEVRAILQELGIDAQRVRICSVASNQRTTSLRAIEDMQMYLQGKGPVRVLEGDR